MSITRGTVAILAGVLLTCSAAEAQQRSQVCDAADAARAPTDSVARFRADLAAYIHETLDSLPAVPGVSIAVVRGDHALMTCGFGLADVENGRTLTPETSIYLASNTKPFVGLLAALLAERGVLRLSEPITRDFGTQAFPPDVHADSVTLRHLLTHTAGLSNDPIVFRTAYTGDHDPAVLHELLAVTSHREGAPRGTFGYTNLGYVLTAMVMQQATSRSWKDLLDEHVLAPLGLENTTARVSGVDTVAHPHAAAYRATGYATRQRIALRKADATMHAAGGMISTPQDLQRWLRVLVNDGSIDGRQLLSPAALADAVRIQAEAPGSTGPFSREGYGLGWLVGGYGGDPLIYHFGSFAGTHSMVSWMPGRDLGVAAFVNEDVTGVRLSAVISMFAYDWWTGADNPAAGANALRSLLVGMLRDEAAVAAGVPAQFTHAQAEALAGTYHSPPYGALTIRRAGDGLEVDIGLLHGRALAADGPGRFLVELVPGRPEVFTYEPGTARVRSVRYEDYTIFER